MIKPNFIIVGEAKCGTSALHYYLSLHPQIFVSDFKEPHYFSTDLIKESDQFHNKKLHFPIRTLNQYQSLFDTNKKAIVFGESSSSYLLSDEAARNIFQHNPHTKILILFREPATFLLSYHAQCILSHGEIILDLEEALEAEFKRANGNNIPFNNVAVSFLLYSKRLRMFSNLMKYVSIFPKENIKIVIYEDFKKNNTKILSDILTFLGVHPFNYNHLFKVNERKTVNNILLYQLIHHPYVWKVPKSIIPNILYLRIKDVVESFLVKKSEDLSINEDLRLKLNLRYQKEIRKLSDFLNRDLEEIWRVK